MPPLGFHEPLPTARSPWELSGRQVSGNLSTPPSPFVQGNGPPAPNGRTGVGDGGNFQIPTDGVRSVCKTPRAQTFHSRYQNDRCSHEQWEFDFCDPRGPLELRKQGPWAKFQRGVQIFWPKIADFSANAVT
eukprot:gene10236-biopygen10808